MVFVKKEQQKKPCITNDILTNVITVCNEEPAIFYVGCRLPTHFSSFSFIWWETLWEFHRFWCTNQIGGPFPVGGEVRQSSVRRPRLLPSRVRVQKKEVFLLQLTSCRDDHIWQGYKQTIGAIYLMLLASLQVGLTFLPVSFPFTFAFLFPPPVFFFWFTSPHFLHFLSARQESFTDCSASSHSLNI